MHEALRPNSDVDNILKERREGWWVFKKLSHWLFLDKNYIKSSQKLLLTAARKVHGDLEERNIEPVTVAKSSGIFMAIFFSEDVDSCRTWEVDLSEKYNWLCFSLFIDRNIVIYICNIRAGYQNDYNEDQEQIQETYSSRWDS